MRHPAVRKTAVSRWQRRAAHRAIHRRLAFEPLEDRRLRAVFTVSNLNDAPVAAAGAAPGTLRQAIFDANHTAGDDSIVFAPALTSGGPATIKLSSAGQLSISSNVTVSGPGADLLTVKAYDPTPGAKDGLGARVLDIQLSGAGTLVMLQGLTFTGGDVAGDGGGIRSDGTLTVVECKIKDNSAMGTGVVSGGGIAISAIGTLQITDSTISGNQLHGDVTYGGGIGAGGNLSLVRTIVTGNQADGDTDSYGGGIAAAAQAVVADSQITLNDAAIAGSTTVGPSRGGGIDSRQSLILVGSTVSDNHAARSGGGVSANLLATISNSTISGNSADLGAGIYGFENGIGNTISLVNSTVAGNTGGGVRNLGYLSITGSRIEGNSRDGVTHYGDLTISASTIKSNLVGVTITTGSGQSAAILDSEISNNIGGGGIDHIHAGGPLDQLEVTSCSISGNSGISWGGIHSTGSLVLDSTTVSDNTGTGVAAAGTVSIVNSTISHNTGFNGGGVSLGAGGAATATIAHSTITANRASTTGGGILVAGGASVLLDHTIVAGNMLVSTARQDVSGALSARYSLIGDDTGAAVSDVTGNMIGHAAKPIDPQLGPLTFNGGPTRTQVPLVGSPVIDVGDPAATAGDGAVPLVDQRGAPFTRVADGKPPAGARIDVGAIEWQPHAMPELLGDNNLDGRVDAADYTIWRDTLGMTVEPYGGADADGNGKIAIVDYQLWKSHFAQSLDSPGRAAGGGSISVAAAAESANQVDTLVAAQAPVTSMSLPPVGDRARVTTSAAAAARHPGRQVRMIATQVPAVDALAVWLAGQHPPYKRVPADNVVSEDEVASSSARECSVFQAADAALEILGTSRRRR